MNTEPAGTAGALRYDTAVDDEEDDIEEEEREAYRASNSTLSNSYTCSTEHIHSASRAQSAHTQHTRYRWLAAVQGECG